MIKIIYENCTYNFQYDNKNLQKVMENDIRWASHVYHVHVLASQQ